jgi:hypothetical protein
MKQAPEESLQLWTFAWSSPSPYIYSGLAILGVKPYKNPRILRGNAKYKLCGIPFDKQCQNSLKVKDFYRV